MGAGPAAIGPLSRPESADRSIIGFIKLSHHKGTINALSWTLIGLSPATKPLRGLVERIAPFLNVQRAGKGDGPRPAHR
jgi:hypothetical protein